MSLSELCDLAVQAGYEAICMRASQVGVQSPPDVVAEASETIRRRDLRVTMITGDFDIVYNNDRGPACLTNITPHLNLAEALDACMIRVCLKSEKDIASACRAADEAIERGCVGWTLEVRLSSSGAQRLYDSFGFESAGVRQKYYDNVEDAIVMWCHDIQSSEYRERLDTIRSESDVVAAASVEENAHG